MRFTKAMQMQDFGQIPRKDKLEKGGKVWGLELDLGQYA
jgi:hypothetical protein